MTVAGVVFAVLAVVVSTAEAYGAEGPISAAWGGDGFFCAIQANGKQELACWSKVGSSSPSAAAATAATFAVLPPVAELSGGEGFMCGIHAQASTALCWRANTTADGLVPPRLRSTAYAHIAAGAAHVCAARGSYLAGSNYSEYGSVDCWSVSAVNYMISQPSLTSRRLVAGDGYTCGEVADGGFTCWGPKSAVLGLSESVVKHYSLLASSRDSVCGISEYSGEVKCWGMITSVAAAPTGVRFVSLTAGAEHFCGIRESDHGLQCWGRFNSTAVPATSGFLAISASDSMTCGVRESDLLLDCWGEDSLPPASNYTPPLQLSSPGLCTATRCAEGEFSFNASVLNVPDLSNLCINQTLQICSPCGYNCSKGFFPSSKCGADANRVCTDCSLCQNSSCSHICDKAIVDKSDSKQDWLKKLGVAIGASIVSCAAVIAVAWCFLPRLGLSRNFDCIRKPEVEKEVDETVEVTVPTVVDMATQAFRLSELKDATHGFKEFKELGRGSYGFVYKAILADGRQVAVKRASAATRIRTNSKDFESELESLCNIRHGNLVNLLGYCAEMGERLLVYEYMPHGTLYDHLHGGLSPLNWTMRLKICLQSARGLEYLHKEAIPPIIHGDVKTSNILLDSEWDARVADFGLLSSGDRSTGNGGVYTAPEYAKTQNLTEKSDVYSFGVVLLEVLSGRKAYEKDSEPSSIVEWAVPKIKDGETAALIDSSIEPPKNLESLLRLGEIAELAVREQRHHRPNMSTLASFLEQIVKAWCGSL